MSEVQTLSGMVEQLGQPKDQSTPEPVSGTEKLIRADSHRREKERLQRRSEIRQDITKREKLVRELSLIDDQLRILDAKADEAANRHQADTEPIQEKLQSADGEKKAKLLSQLTECNVRLETDLDVIRRCRDPLLVKHRETRSGVARCRTAMALSGDGVGSPALLAEMFSCKKRLEAASARVAVAQSQAAYSESELEFYRTTKIVPNSFGHSAIDARPTIDFAAVSVLSQRVSRWRTELLHASQELDEVQRAMSEVEQQLRDE